VALIKEEEAMLVLSRKQNESILIGSDIRVTVTRISGNRVALGIEAPPEIAVVRAEVLNRPKQEACAVAGDRCTTLSDGK
jgi:carbon storage regulator